MIEVKAPGNFDNTEKYLLSLTQVDILSVLNKYGQVGLQALISNTPKDTGDTARSWSYEVGQNGRRYYIVWKNDHVIDNVPVAILIEYGHATGTGGWVQGREFINASIQPLFDMMAEEVSRQVTNGNN